MSYPDEPYPLQNMRDPGESQHLPPPEDDDRAKAYHQQVPSCNVALPQQVYPVVYGLSAPQHTAFGQPAPRQRTAIACKYCRRRKIRCSGFEQNHQGRCYNCERFQQDCVFTPVSSQAQAFVLAHVAYPHIRNKAVGPNDHGRITYPEPQQLYGAYGQPLGQIPLPASRKRPRAEPHASILPPPVPGQPGCPRSEGPRRQAVEDDLRLLPVTAATGSSQVNSNYLPGSSTSSDSGLRLSQDSGLPSLNSVLPPLSRTHPPKSSPDDRADPMSLSNIMETRPNTNVNKNILSRLDGKGRSISHYPTVGNTATFMRAEQCGKTS